MSTQGRDDHRAVAGRPGTAPDCEHTGAADADESSASFDEIDEAIEESMDASDPPSFAPQTSVGPPSHADVEAGGRD